MSSYTNSPEAPTVASLAVLVARIGAIMLGGEAIVMAIFYLMDYGTHDTIMIFLDPIMLAALSTPLLYRYVFKPLRHALLAHERASKALQTSETKYKTLFDSSRDAIMTLTPQGGFLSGNAATVMMFGCKDEQEFITQTPASLSPEYQPDGTLSSTKAQQMMAIAMETGSHFFEWRHKRMDGTEFPATVLLTRMELEGKSMFQATVRDITERKQAEEQLHKLSVAVEQSPLTVVITDTQGKIEYVNPRFTETTGYTPEEAVGQNPRVLKSGHMSPDGYKEMWETIVAGNTWRGEFHNKRKNGELYWEAASISPIRNPQGEITHFLAVKEDITQQKQTEVELHRAKEAAEAASQTKSEFLANMSHEIRTPMTAILGFADVLCENIGCCSNCPKHKTCEVQTVNLQYLSIIRSNGQHLLQIINDILDLSKIEAGKLEVERIKCSPIQLVVEVESLLRVRANGKRLDFKVEYEGVIPESIQTDPVRLRQILINLIGNAIKFTEIGGIKVITRLLEATSADQPEPMMQFDIIDTGIGMSVRQLGRLFQPFQQADSSTNRKFGGTGLGLCISKRLAEQLGGDIAVESKLGQGSTFRVTVVTGPLDEVKLLEDPTEAEGPRVCRTDDASPTARKLDCRVLLVEDGPDNQHLVSVLLRKAGAEVDIADNGQIAVQKALAAKDEGHPFDVILMDMQMPVMDGYDATKLLRDQGYTGPIIALTAHAMESDRRKCLETGCDDFISKPINRNMLIETIQRNLADKSCPTNHATDPPDILVSDLADDPDFAVLVERFVAELPGKIAEIETKFTEQDLETLASLAHQLAGGAGGYGFPAITEVARNLEQHLMGQPDFDKLEKKVKELAALCLCARATRSTA